MQVILDSSFARPGSAPIWGGKKGEFRDWTNGEEKGYFRVVSVGNRLGHLIFDCRMYCGLSCRMQGCQSVITLIRTGSCVGAKGLF